MATKPARGINLAKKHISMIKNRDAKKFGYHDGGMHAYDAAINAHFVMIGTASFLNDVICPVYTFGQACATDVDLRQRVEARLPRVRANLPFST